MLFFTATWEQGGPRSSLMPDAHGGPKKPLLPVSIVEQVPTHRFPGSHVCPLTAPNIPIPTHLCPRTRLHRQPCGRASQAPRASLPSLGHMEGLGCLVPPGMHLQIVQRLCLHDRACRAERQGDLHGLGGAERRVDLEWGGGGQAKAGEREAPQGWWGAGADTGQAGSWGSGAWQQWGRRLSSEPASPQARPRPEGQAPNPHSQPSMAPQTGREPGLAEAHLCSPFFSG